MQDVLLWIVPAQRVMSFRPQAVVANTSQAVGAAAIDSERFGAQDEGSPRHQSQRDDGKPWRFVQAKLGFLVYTDGAGRAKCPQNLAQYTSLVTDLSQAVDTKTASPKEFKRAMYSTGANRRQRAELLAIFQAQSMHTLCDALRAIKARQRDGAKLLKLLKAADATKWRFGNEYLHAAFEPWSDEVEYDSMSDNCAPVIVGARDERAG